LTRRTYGVTVFGRRYDMAKSCFCGSPLCPICKGKLPSVEDLQKADAAALVRHSATRRTAKFIPEVIARPGIREGLERVGASMGVDINVPHDSCAECGRPYCPECGDPIPVRGDYCKPACRSRAWRKKKAE